MIHKSAATPLASPSPGFTLLEALVVVALLALVLGLSVPGMTGWRERRQLQAEVEDFWNSLMLARAQAVLHQRHVSVCTGGGDLCDPLADWHQGWLVFVDANRNGIRDSGEQLLQRRAPLSERVRMRGNSAVTHHIGYGAEGRSESLSGGFQAGTIAACALGQNTGWRLIINAVWRPRLEQADTPSCS